MNKKTDKYLETKTGIPPSHLSMLDWTPSTVADSESLVDCAQIQIQAAILNKLMRKCPLASLTTF